MIKLSLKKNLACKNMSTSHTSSGHKHTSYKNKIFIMVSLSVSFYVILAGHFLYLILTLLDLLWRYPQFWFKKIHLVFIAVRQKEIHFSNCLLHLWRQDDATQVISQTASRSRSALGGVMLNKTVHWCNVRRVGYVNAIFITSDQEEISVKIRS